MGKWKELAEPLDDRDAPTMKPTQEQVIAWAREAGVHEQWFKGDDCPPIVFRLATLAYEAGRKDENEACAKVCDEIAIGDSYQGNYVGSSGCAKAIRARRAQ